MKLLKDLFFASWRNSDIGICLSGGGALGFAHIGVLQALEDHGIYPKHIVGASMGAIVGAFYAAGFTPAEMLQMIKDDKLYKVTKLMTFHASFLRNGFSDHSMLRSLIKEQVPHNTFEQLNKRFHVCVVNLKTSEWEIKSTGDLDVWVAASASIPGIFQAIKVDDNYYVDGGLLNNMPAQALEESSPTIIGSDVIPHIQPDELNKTIDTMAYSVRALLHQNSKEGRDLCRFTIEPLAIEKYHEFSFDAYNEIYQYGYSATTKFIAENPEITKISQLAKA